MPHIVGWRTQSQELQTSPHDAFIQIAGVNDLLRRPAESSETLPQQRQQE